MCCRDPQALRIIDEAIQIHGAHGLSQDSRLSDAYMDVRHVRLADGPDIVLFPPCSVSYWFHLNAYLWVGPSSELSSFLLRIRCVQVHLELVAKQELARPTSELARQLSGTNENIARVGFFKNADASAVKSRL